MREYDFITLDVFTTRPFAGNPLAVLPDATGLETAAMQAIAAEFNLSETAFVFPGAPPRLRIFTPHDELPFAGHPTIGSAHALAQTGALDLNDPAAALLERAGTVRLTRDEVPAPGVIFLHAPAAPAPGPALPEPQLLARMLGLAEADLHPDWPIEAWSAGVPFACIPLCDPGRLDRIAFDSAVWAQSLRGGWAEKVYAFAPERTPGQLSARMFAPSPSLGIPEDPATGAAAVALAGYLDRRVEPAGSESGVDWEIAQGARMGRPSRMYLHYARAAGDPLHVRLGGAAVAISRGRLRAPESC